MRTIHVVVHHSSLDSVILFSPHSPGHIEDFDLFVFSLFFPFDPCSPACPPPSGLSLMVDGVPGLSLNASGIVFHSDVVSTGQAVQLQGVQALEVNPAEETVSLNTGFSAANGVVIGSSSTFSLRPNPLGAADPPLVTIGDVTPSGTLRVEGSVRCSKGSPASPGSNVGFAFEDESQSGLFMDSSC